MFGFAPSAPASGLVSRLTDEACLRRHGRFGVPNSDETDEGAIGMGSEHLEDQEDMEDMGIDALTGRVAIVFEGRHAAACASNFGT